MDSSEKLLLLDDSHKYGGTAGVHTEDVVSSDSKASNRGLLRVTGKVTVEPLIVLVVVAYSAVTPVTQQYVYYRLGEQAGLDNLTFSEDDQKCNIDFNDTYFLRQQKVQAEASLFTMTMTFLYIIPALFATLLLGPYSDRVGRKYAMVPALGGLFLRTLMMLFTVMFHLPLWTLLPFVFLEGLLGSQANVLVACFAYVSDITTHSTRSRHLVIIEVCMGLGTTAAQIGIGYLISGLGFLWPCVFMLTLNSLSLLYTVVFLPETIVKDTNARFFRMSHLRKVIDLYRHDNECQRRWKLRLALVLSGMLTFTDIGMTEVQTLYLLNSPLCWSSITIGYFLGELCITKNMGALLMMMLCLRRTGDVGLVILGICSSIAYQLTLSFATSSVLVFLAPVFGFAMLLNTSMLRSAVSKTVSADEQGALFASLGWFQLLSALLGVFAFNGLYSVTLYLVHGFVFIVAACLYAVAVILAGILWFGMRKDVYVLVKDRKIDPTSTS